MISLSLSQILDLFYTANIHLSGTVVHHCLLPECELFADNSDHPVHHRNNICLLFQYPHDTVNIPDTQSLLQHLSPVDTVHHIDSVAFPFSPETPADGHLSEFIHFHPLFHDQ